MTEAELREKVVEHLAQGPRSTNYLIEHLLDAQFRKEDPTGDIVQEVIWELAEDQAVDWAANGLVYLKENANV